MNLCLQKKSEINVHFQILKNVHFGVVIYKMRYGLPTRKSIIIYESGFADRVVSLRLAAELAGIPIKTKRQFQKVSKSRRDKLLDALNGFPRVFYDAMSGM